MSGLDGIVLDLDDTLLDTTRLLLPAADRRVARAFRGLGASDEPSALIARLAEIRAAGSADAIGALAEELGLGADGRAAALRAFLEFADEVPPLALEPAVAEALDDLAGMAPLALLTQGHAPTQRAKVERLGIAARFRRIVLVDGDLRDGKIPALRELVAVEGWDPSRVVVCGDRPSADVRAAHANGCRGVLVRRPGAEHAREVPARPDDRPWRTLVSVRELPDLLRREGLASAGRPSG